jgi:hypothetical protein
LLIVALGSALLVTGMLPPEHLHHATPTRPHTTVHSHFPTLQERPSTHGPGLSASDNDDHDAVALDAQVLSRMPAPPPFGVPLVPELAWMSPPPPSSGSVVAFELRPPESPPPRSTASRAPPTC